MERINVNKEEKKQMPDESEQVTKKKLYKKEKW